MRANRTAGCISILILGLLAASSADAQRSRLAAPISGRSRIDVAGHINPRLRAATDQGAVDPSLELSSVTLVLEPTAEQNSALDQLLADQQNPRSTSYHRWLTPEEYADRFGASSADIQKIRQWIEGQGLTVTAVARARNSITFQGSADAVQNLLSVELHQFEVDGEVHFANTAEPKIPSSLQGMVRAVHGLHDFRFGSRARVRSVSGLLPRYTAVSGNHYVTPGDFAMIFNLKPLYDAGYKGAGQSIVVVGQSQYRTNDVTLFRSAFGLSSNLPRNILVPGNRDPGIVRGDVDEASLDVEWAGGVAPEASLIYVYAPDVTDAVEYAINQNLAPVISMSYGLCELDTAAADANTLRTWSKQAAAQGITWIAASGDYGAADCGTTSTHLGLSVDLPSALPEVTGVGGTTLNEGSGTYWADHTSSTGVSALSYIPEIVWNESTTTELSASGGGASTFFTKPSWQTGTGVPSDGARDVPDISFPASPSHDGYLVYTSGSLSVIGGTSAGAPCFAAVIAVLNQYLTSTGVQSTAGVGNANPKLYSLAQSNPAVFHDVTSGNNIVTVCPTRRTCNSPIGYNAGVGYDQVTGLGTLDVSQLVQAWSATTFQPRTANMSLSASATSITDADSVVLTATLPDSGGGVPTGTVTFYVGSTVLGTATLTASGSSGAVGSVTVSGASLSLGILNLTAQYSGDSVYGTATASVSLTVRSSYTGPPVITGLTNAASFRQVYAPGMLLTVFGQGLASTIDIASTLPLPLELSGVSVTINGVSAPIWYVSPNQLNIQIPYEIATSGTVTLVVKNNGQTASSTLTMAAAAPGVFVDGNNAPVPSTAGKAGQVLTMFVTGAGALSPSLATGATPAASTPVASLPKPTQNVTVTVDGTSSTLQFYGNTSGVVGAIQVNYQVPASIGSGTHSVVVSVGGVASAPVTLIVQ